MKEKGEEEKKQNREAEARQKLGPGPWSGASRKGTGRPRALASIKNDYFTKGKIGFLGPLICWFLGLGLGLGLRQGLGQSLGPASGPSPGPETNKLRGPENLLVLL